VSSCHAGCRELVGEFAAGVHIRHGRRIWSATERLSRDKHRGRADPIVQPLSAQLGEALAKECAARLPLPWARYVRLSGVRSINARAFCESEALCCGCTRWQICTRRAIQHDYSGRVPNHASSRAVAEEIARTRRQLDLQRQDAFRALPRRRRARPLRSRRASGRATT